jgi:hypothetical protein
MKVRESSPRARVSASRRRVCALEKVADGVLGLTGDGGGADGKQNNEAETMVLTSRWFASCNGEEKWLVLRAVAMWSWARACTTAVEGSRDGDFTR